MNKVVLFDMDGTLLDLAFDDFIWNECLPKRHSETHHLSLTESQEILNQFYRSHKHTLAWYSSNFWTQTTGVDVLKLQQNFSIKLKQVRMHGAAQRFKSTRLSMLASHQC